MHCALWRGCGGSTYGLIVLRLCRTSTPPANPPVGGCMPVNYCTLGEEEREEGRGREGDEEHRNKKEKKKKRRRWWWRRRRRVVVMGRGRAALLKYDHVFEIDRKQARLCCYHGIL